jgi:hypothetical protein
MAATLLLASVIATGWAGGRSASATARTTTSPPFLTLLFAHSAWTAVDSQCQPLPGIVTLGDQAREYAARHLAVSASVVTSWVASQTRTCIAHDPLKPQPKPLLIASWADLAMLRATYGWKFISHGRYYLDVTALPSWQQNAEICGSLKDLQAKGYAEAAGLFAYPNNLYNQTVQEQVVRRCYDYGRVFATVPNTQSAMVSPWFVQAFSFNGGRCNNPALSCSKLSTPYPYGSPIVLGTYMNPGPGQWSIVQLYRFAVGANTTGSTLQWDCRSPDWHDHWTNNSELYCWQDYLQALNTIGKSVVTINPARVAVAWGRSPGGP